MDAGFLDMLEHARNDDIGAVSDRVDIDLDRVTQILIDQNWCITRDLNRRLEIFLELRATVDALHRPPAVPTAGPHQHTTAAPPGSPAHHRAAAADSRRHR